MQHISKKIYSLQKYENSEHTDTFQTCKTNTFDKEGNIITIIFV